MADANFRTGIPIDGVQYIIDARWNARDGAWYLDLLDAEEQPIRYGIKVVLGAALGGVVGRLDPNFPPGILIASDLSGEGVEATLEDLGDRVPIHFIPTSELGS